MKGSSLIIWGIIFGVIGTGFLAYGKKQQAIVPLCTGVALFMLPYLVSNTYLLITMGILLIALPFFVRI